MESAVLEEIKAYMVEERRYFHKYPELSWNEFNTQKHVIEQLKNMGLQPRAIAKTGIVADIVGGEGPVIVVRADMDALALDDTCGAEYQSSHKGVCHACGHDGHMAMLLGLAKFFTMQQAELLGTVRVIFQPSEECFPDGAVQMIKEGVLNEAAAIIGVHLWQPLKVGQLGISYGRLMAAPAKFTIRVKGKGGHGSMPHQTVDPIQAAAQIAVALNTVVSRKIDPLEPVVLTVGTFHAGEAFNIIPETAEITGNIRTFAAAVEERVLAELKRLAEGICEAAGASCEVEVLHGIPAVVNNRTVAEIMAKAGTEVLGSAGVTEVKPVMISEDFAHYLQLIPGAFCFVGCGDQEKAVYPHHHQKFDISEAALGYGMQTMVNTVVALLKEYRR